MLKEFFIALMIVALTLGAWPLMADEPKEATESSEPTEAIKKLAEGNSAFALDLYGQLAKPEGNLFFSPLSLSAVLALAHQGAKGETQSQLEKTLRFPKDAAEPPAQTMAELAQYLAKKATGAGKDSSQDKAGQNNEKSSDQKTVDFSLANSLWPKLGLQLRPEYLKGLGEKPPIFELDYVNDGDGAKTKINDWISENTNGKIENFLDSPPPANSTLILVNAVYFLGQWTKSFDPKKTIEQEFALGDGQKVKVPFLNQTDSWNYLAAEGAQILELPYGNGDYSFLMLLPEDKPGALLELEKKLTLENLNNWRENLKKERVKVSIPKFKTTWGANSLTQPLVELGLIAPFQPRADFSGFALDNQTVISDILQKAFVSLDESGTEAAAASAIISRTSIDLTPRLLADRPFIFLIQEKSTNSILFLGRLADPRS
ncbi:MAG: serpin family protein [Deltaproteobacteria bacterium]|nr:serpin family protein [Deltaproteobacteria bacterium]